MIKKSFFRLPNVRIMQMLYPTFISNLFSMQYYKRNLYAICTPIRFCQRATWHNMSFRIPLTTNFFILSMSLKFLYKMSWIIRVWVIFTLEEVFLFFSSWKIWIPSNEYIGCYMYACISLWFLFILQCNLSLNVVFLT